MYKRDDMTVEDDCVHDDQGRFCFNLFAFLVGLGRMRRCAMNTCLPENFFSSSRTSLG